MCLAIVKPAKARVLKRTLAAGFTQNSDGAGFAWYDPDSELVWEQKGFWNFKQFWQAYRLHEHQNVLIHFRAATHGSKCTENCHPFRVAKDVVMAHNGVLSDYLPVGQDDRSDTRIFAEDFIEPVMKQAIDPVAFIHTPQVMKMLKEIVGFWNKVVFLTPKGFLFINESKGWWINDVWFSSGNPDWRTNVTATSVFYGGDWGEDDNVVQNYGRIKSNEKKWSADQRDKDFYKTMPPYGTREYEEWWQDRGYERSGSGKDFGWVKKFSTGKSDPPDVITDDEEEDINSDEAIRERMRKGLEPSNGSRPRDPEAAQASLQLAVRSGERGEPTSEAEEPNPSIWEIWEAAQADLKTTELREGTNMSEAGRKAVRAQIEANKNRVAHNRQIIQQGLAVAPPGSVIRTQLVQVLEDMDEIERAATELAKTGM